MKKNEVKLYFPKFKFELALKMNDILKKIGIK